MSDKVYRAAAIGRTGKGNWGHGLHLGLKNHPRIEVVAVADEDAQERQVKQEELAASRAYADWREMLEAEQPEVVTVGPRWTDCHLEMVLACLEVGAHVYCEKPMTWNLAEGDQIVAKAEETGRKVAVAHQGAYMPRIQHVKEVLAQGQIGAVQAIRAHGKQDRRGGGEDMIVLGTHLFNMMRLFVGDVAVDDGAHHARRPCANSRRCAGGDRAGGSHRWRLHQQLLRLQKRSGGLFLIRGNTSRAGGRGWVWRSRAAKA